MTTVYSTQTLDHLGIVAGVCEQIGLIEQIDARMPNTGRTVSVGQAVQAMVLNGLGFVGRALYLTPEFYRTKPLDLLIGEGIEAEDLNSDSLGKALDYLYENGVSELFAAVSAQALKAFRIVVRFAHLDTTAFSLEGAYDMEEEADEAGEPQPIKITYGYSKDHRPDLKQAILGMISANRTSIPAYLSAVSGNVSDKTSLPEMAQVYLEQFTAEAETPILVADAALYGADTINALSENKWITRVPATLAEAKEALATCEQEDMQVSERAGYRYKEMTSEYGGVKQRWLVVFSKDRYQQALAQLEKQIEREHEQLVKQIKKLERQLFSCEEDAHKAFSKTAPWKYHTLGAVVSARERYAQPGRPTSGSPTVIGWLLDVTLERDESKISERHKPLGKYILATNVLDQEELPAEELLTVYKDQNRSVERGFRFLKDPFFASGFFLKKPSRIMGLLMVMGLSLLIYALAEHQLRQQLVEQDQSIPDQKGKPTQNPTMRRVFQIFEGIHILTVEDQGLRKRTVTNVCAVHLQIATLLGNLILKFYVFEDSPL